MNYLRLLAVPLRSSFARHLETTGAAPVETLSKHLILEPLQGRECIRVSGEEVVPFLQGLTTNDLEHLRERPGVQPLEAMYTMFLNKTGRVLYDTIIYRSKEPNTFYIECDKKVSGELRRHLRLYRVRRKIDIDLKEDIKTWVIFSPNAEKEHEGVAFTASKFSKGIEVARDPRLRDLGLRLLANVEKTWKQVSQAFTQNDAVKVIQPSTDYDYRLHRYRYGVGEGVQDMPPGKCFPLESNGDFLHGVSFQKGCYLGQEVTARVHHTGVIRKRLMPVELTEALEGESLPEIQIQSGTKIGNIRGVQKNHALALVRVEHVVDANLFSIDGDPCFVKKPNWWPAELPKRQAMRE